MFDEWSVHYGHSGDENATVGSPNLLVSLSQQLLRFSMLVRGARKDTILSLRRATR